MITAKSAGCYSIEGFFLALGTLGKVGKKKGGILRESWRTESWRKYLVTVKKLYSLGHSHPSTPNV